MADSPRRGETWLVDLGNPIGHESAFYRPALVVSDDPANQHGLVTVCPIASARRNYPTRVEITPGRSGLDVTSYVQGEQVRTISTDRLVHRLGRAEVTVQHGLDHVLRMLLRL